MHAALPAAASRPREIAGYLVTRYQRHVSWCLCDDGAVAGALDNQRNAGHDAPRVAPTNAFSANETGNIASSSHKRGVVCVAAASDRPRLPAFVIHCQRPPATAYPTFVSGSLADARMNAIVAGRCGMNVLAVANDEISRSIGQVRLHGS